jgi:hypothetical protein
MNDPSSMRIGIPLLLLAIALVACRPAESQLSRRASLGTPVTLAPGERVEFPDEQLELTFIAVASDSRCPSDTTCVWAGEALVQLTIQTGSESAQREIVAGQGVDVGKHRINVLGLQPEAVSTRKIAPDEYRVTLEVRAAG